MRIPWVIEEKLESYERMFVYYQRQYMRTGELIYAIYVDQYKERIATLRWVLKRK